jgi:hypothetical protein
MQTIQPSKLLKIALLADAAATGATAAIQLVGGQFLSQHLALPSQLLTGTGWFMAAYAAALVILANSQSVWKALVYFIVFGNVAWAAITLDIVVTDMVAPNGLGVAYLALLSLAVLGFAALEFAGLKASSGDVPLRSSHAVQ